MEIDVIGSGSSGNAYLLKECDRSIMIDPGLPINDIRRKAKINLALLDACLISHEHKDHTKSINNIGKLGIPCLGSNGTLNHFPKLNGTRKVVEAKKETNCNGWDILPFETIHDSSEPYGYVIRSPKGKKILYATDTCYIGYKFKGITHYMVECNYQEKYLQENQDISEELKTRIRLSHLELETVKRFFLAQDLSKTEAIYLIHLSSFNASKEEVKKEIMDITGKNVMVFR